MRLFRTFDLVVRNRIRWKNSEPSKRSILAKSIRRELVDMGPTFVKVGQYISTRNDFFPEELTKEFSKLQDSVEPFDISIIDLEVPNLIVTPEPIASGSIGQVHKAYYNDKKCIVKLLRPDIQEQVDEDIFNLKIISRIINIFSPGGSDDIQMFLREFENMIIMETNFNKEYENMKNFRKNFEEIEWIIVPEVYYASQNILIMEYVKSQKITETSSYNKKSLAWSLTKSQILQIINTGYFHGDPHPGNVGVRDGKLVYYDFGMVSYISESQKNALKTLLVAISSKDEKQIISILSYLDLVGNDKEEVSKFINIFLNYIDDNNPSKLKKLVELKSNPLKISGSFFYLIRSFSIIEGVCKNLDTTYNTNEFIIKFVEESDIFEDMFLETLRTTFSDMNNMSYRLTTIENAIETNRKSSSNRNFIILFILLVSDWIVGFFG